MENKTYFCKPAAKQNTHIAALIYQGLFQTLGACVRFLGQISENFYPFLMKIFFKKNQGTGLGETDAPNKGLE